MFSNAYHSFKLVRATQRPRAAWVAKACIFAATMLHASCVPTCTYELETEGTTMQHNTARNFAAWFINPSAIGCPSSPSCAGHQQ